MINSILMHQSYGRPTGAYTSAALNFVRFLLRKR